MNSQELKEILDAIIRGSKKLAVDEFKGRGEDIGKDAKEFLENSKSKIKEWCEKLVSGELKQNEFEYLVKNQANLLKMKTLKQSGMALVAIDNVRQGILDVVSKVILSKVLP